MSTKRNLTVVILTYNEAENLPKCLLSLEGLNAATYVVDSGSTDGTQAIAAAAGCHVVQHPFENYSQQRNWSLNNLPIQTPWTLCLDADERLLPDLAQEIHDVVTNPKIEYAGYILRKRTIFLGKWIRFGGQYPNCHLNLFRTGYGRCEERRYDQHFVVDGPVGKLKYDYEDLITCNISRWIERHNVWASAEAEELLRFKNKETHSHQNQVKPSLTGNRIQRLRFLRNRIYGSFPLFIRPFLFWFYSYFLRGGFLDGVEGLIFFTLHRFWFRFLVDAKLYEMTALPRKNNNRKLSKAS